VPDALRSPRALVLLAFASIWFVWGSTFLVIRHAIADIPPILMCGIRLASAGAMLLAWARLRGEPWPRGRQWWNAALVGLLLPGIGNTAVTLGIGHVPSGLVALLVSTIPLWMGLLSSFGPDAEPPGRRAGSGLALGFAGIALLIGPGLLTGHDETLSPFWALVPIAGSLSWAWGSLWSRRVPLPGSPLVSTGVGLLASGLALLLLSAAVGDLATWRPGDVGWGAWASVAYLSVFGSVLAFTAYIYLLGRVAPAKVATYAFVNPIVAMFLGFAFGGETLTPRTLAAAAVVLVAVWLITTAGSTTKAWAARAAGARTDPGAIPIRQR
jgi:drug/metabolite transporter (DMT)-like permease